MYGEVLPANYLKSLSKYSANTPKIIPVFFPKDFTRKQDVAV